MLLKIGELAGRTGLTVRTLHHYDAIKLLCPSARSEAGYRLYNRTDIARLHRIQALRRLDLSLAEIAALLEGDGIDLQTVIEQQIVVLDRQVERAIDLRHRLTSLSRRLGEQGEPDLHDWLTTLELMGLYDKYFTHEEWIAFRSLGEHRHADTRKQVDEAIAAVHSLIGRTVPPESTEAKALGRRWLMLMNNFMGDNAYLMAKSDAMHRNEPAVQSLTGVDTAVLDYLTRATGAYRLDRYARFLDADEIARARDSYFQHYPRWPALFAEARTLLDRRTDAASPEAQDLCRRWIRLFQDSWGTDPALRLKVRRAHQEDPEILAGSGISKEMMEFVARGIALAAAQQP
ncbi:MAG TPA: MerR family transcriptional regulator [Paucimonas sp.]|nr:MerR family transcriptional regulator [Paucimonas sp.]HJW56577.1 MerR family transcriptional regulator [Burkholderiaceae bacterium]